MYIYFYMSYIYTRTNNYPHSHKTPTNIQQPHQTSLSKSHYPLHNSQCPLQQHGDRTGIHFFTTHIVCICSLLHT